MEIKLKNVRLAFPELFAPKAIQGGNPRFSACFIIDPKSPNAKAIADAIDKVAKEAFKDKAPAVLKKLRDDKRVCYRTEERVNKDGDVYDGFEGMYSINGSNKVKPLLLDESRNEIGESAGKLYGGAYVNAIIDVWAQNNPDPKIGRRINCTVLGVQFAKHGDAFGGARVATVDSFDTIETSGDEDELA